MTKTDEKLSGPMQRIDPPFLSLIQLAAASSTGDSTPSTTKRASSNS